MTDPAPDPRPQPRWGQYADVPPPAPQYPPPSIPEPAPAPRRTGDILLTTMLLLVGVYDVVAQWPLYASLGSALRQAYTLQGVGEFTSTALADSLGMMLNIVRTVLLVLAILWALVRIGRGRRAFWVPLSAGVLAGLVVIGFLFAIMLQDPALLEYARRTTGG